MSVPLGSCLLFGAGKPPLDPRSWDGCFPRRDASSDAERIRGKGEGWGRGLGRSLSFGLGASGGASGRGIKAGVGLCALGFGLPEKQIPRFARNDTALRLRSGRVGRERARLG